MHDEGVIGQASRERRRENEDKGVDYGKPVIREMGHSRGRKAIRFLNRPLNGVGIDSVT